MSLTTDASVFVAYFRLTEIQYAASRALLGSLVGHPDDLILPTLVLIETAASLARVTNNNVLALAAADFIRALPDLTLIDLSPERAMAVCSVACERRLRGADAVYVQAALESGSTLICWDGEMLDRASAVVTTMTPDDYLASLTIGS